MSKKRGMKAVEKQGSGPDIQSQFFDEVDPQKADAVEVDDSSRISRAQIELLTIFARHVVAELRRPAAE